ncbi:hypothetical protein [Mycobacteroides abscessus]
MPDLPERVFTPTPPTTAIIVIVTEPTNTETAGYPNNYWFGQFISWYRTAHQFTCDKIADAGGPSRGTQAPIEKGSNVTVTQDTIDKLIHAYTALVPAEHPFNASMLRAATAVLSTSLPDPQRLQHLRNTANDWSNENQIFLGLEVGSEHKIHAHGVALIDDYNHPFPYSTDDRREFTDYLATIATRQPSLVLIPAEHQDTLKAGLGRRRWDEIKPNGEDSSVGIRRNWPHTVAFDPICEITNLREALTRAEVLGATGEDASNLALVLIAANKVASRQPHKAPIEVVRHLFSPTDGKGKVSMLLSIYESVDLPADLQALQALADRFLGPWRNEYITSRLNISLGNPEDDLCYNTLPPRAPYKRVPNESLWYYDDIRFPQLPRLLASQYTPALVLTPTSAQIYGHGPCDLLLHWVPARGHRCLLRDRHENRWLAADMPDSYVGRKKYSDDAQ